VPTDKALTANHSGNTRTLFLDKTCPCSALWPAHGARIGTAPRDGAARLLRAELVVVGPRVAAQARLVQRVPEHLHVRRQARKLRGLVGQEGDVAARVAAPQDGHEVEVGPRELVRVKALRAGCGVHQHPRVLHRWGQQRHAALTAQYDGAHATGAVSLPGKVCQASER